MQNGDAGKGPGGTGEQAGTVTGRRIADGAPAPVRRDGPGSRPGPPGHGPPRRGGRRPGGGRAPRTVLLQDIALPQTGSTGRAAVDAGEVRFRASAWLGGCGQREDGARVSVEFRDDAGAPVALSVLGPVSAAARGPATGTVERTAEAAVPPGARTARVLLVLARDGDSAGPGRADALALTLHRAGRTGRRGGGA